VRHCAACSGAILQGHFIEAAAQLRVPQHERLAGRTFEGLAALVQRLRGRAQRGGLGGAKTALHHELLERVQRAQRAHAQQPRNQQKSQQQQLLE
jgi:molybdenum-dependent DNA-binding transcriptional regulator ModE